MVWEKMLGKFVGGKKQNKKVQYVHGWVFAPSKCTLLIYSILIACFEKQFVPLRSPIVAFLYTTSGAVYTGFMSDGLHMPDIGSTKFQPTVYIRTYIEEATVKAVMKKVNPQNAAGPSVLRYSHLQAALCDELVEDLAAFAMLVFSSRVLPQLFWTLHTSANLSALGQKTRPVACGDVLRRVIGAVSCRRYGRKLADYFQPWGQYGVAVSGGVGDNGVHSNTGFRKGLHHSLIRRSKRL